MAVQHRHLETLARCDAFRGLDGAEIDRLDTQCIWRRFDAGAEILGHQDDTADVYFVAAGTVFAWLLEAVVIWQCAHWAGIELSPMGAVLVTTVAVSAQIVAVAPSGFGTYEAATVAAYSALGHDAGAGLVAALLAHALKTAYSLVAGGVALATPQPSMLGRFRLARPDADNELEGVLR